MMGRPNRVGSDIGTCTPGVKYLYDTREIALNTKINLLTRIDVTRVCRNEIPEKFYDEVRACIQDFQRHSLHRVLFLGTNQDAIVAAQAFGIPVQAALTFGNAPENVRAAFRAASDNVGRMRTGNTAGFVTEERTVSVL